MHQWRINTHEQSKDKLKSMETQEFQVTIFEVASDREQRQLFAWFARSKPIEPAVRDFFDDSEPYNRAAKASMEDSEVLRGRVDWQVRTVPVKNPEIMSLANLKEIATTIHIGIARAAKKADRDVVDQPDNQRRLQAQLVDFFDNFLPGCIHYSFLKDPQNYRTHALHSKRTSYALHPLVIRLFANAWSRWTDEPQPQSLQPLAEHLNFLNLQMAHPDNAVEKTFGVLNEKRRFQGLRHKAWSEATSTILRDAKATI